MKFSTRTLKEIPAGTKCVVYRRLAYKAFYDSQTTDDSILIGGTPLDTNAQKDWKETSAHWFAGLAARRGKSQWKGSREQALKRAKRNRFANFGKFQYWIVRAK